MDAEKIQLLAVNLEGKLAAIVYHDLKSHNHIFYKVSKMDADEIKDLMNSQKPVNIPQK